MINSGTRRGAEHRLDDDAARAGLLDILRHAILKRPERLDKHVRKALALLLECLGVIPRLLGVEHRVWDTIDVRGDLQPKDVVCLELARRVARVDGVDDGSCVFQWAARPCAELAADPASVDEPAAGLGLLHLLREHLRVSARL